MKRIVLITLAFVLFTIVGIAQIPSLSLTYNGLALPNGSDVIYSGVPADDEIVADKIAITNDSGNPVNVLVKKVEIQLVDSTSNTFCWGLCFPPNVYISPDPIAIGPGQTNASDFSGHYFPDGHGGLAIIRYVFYNQSDLTDSVCFNAHYDIAVGIEEIASKVEISNAYPNPATSFTQFNYSVEPGVNATLIIRNVLGATINQMALAGQGTARVATHNLTEGIYFYSVMVNGKSTQSGKLIVK
jgi:hypothetical protein